jgi:uncharacterized alkaline shock family protein YloU
MVQEEHPYGEVNIAEDVIATIACLSAVEVKGVAGMSGGITGGIAEVLGKKNLSKGVKVEVKTMCLPAPEPDCGIWDYHS